MTENNQEQPQAQETIPEAGTDEYNEYMAGKARSAREGEGADGEVEKPQVPAIPENGQDKFYNKETGKYDWENHAKELQYRLDKDSSNQEGSSEEPSDGAVYDVVSKAGLDMDTLNNTLIETGDISDDQKDALEKTGIPRELIDNYIENVKYRIENEQAAAFDYIGGKDKWAEIHQYAQTLPDNEKAKYNEMLKSPTDWKVAVDILKQRMGDASLTGREGSLMTGETGNTGSVTGYQSKAEMKRDMASLEYQNDPAFRQRVYAKMQASNFQEEYR